MRLRKHSIPVEKTQLVKGERLMSDLAGAAEKLGTESFDLRPIISSLTFWGVGLSIVAATSSIDSKFISERLQGENAVISVTFLLIVVSVSRTVTRAISFPILRILEGYGWDKVPFLGSWMKVRRIASFKKQLQDAVDTKDQGTPEEITEKQDFINSMPATSRVLPTRLGNILRSGEDYANDRYALDGMRTWSRLWFCIPSHARSILRGARKEIDQAVDGLIWAVLSLGWAYFLSGQYIYLSLAISTVWTIIAYSALLRHAEAWSELLRATFDLYRFNLYTTLSLPLPESPFEEVIANKRYEKRVSIVNDFLFAFVKDDVNYTHVDKQTAAKYPAGASVNQQANA